MATTKDIWSKVHVMSLAPDDASIPAAEKVLKKGGVGTVEATVDGRGWWVVCQGLTDKYQVTVRRVGNKGDYDCTCNCLSYKKPCKHALALLLYLVDHPELRAEVEAPKAAASDFEGLLRGAFREPTDDLPRLVFADFLEENNQPDRAALIRYQCERARLKPGAQRAKELDRLIKPLIEKLHEQIGPLPVGLEWEFVCGFLHLDASQSNLSNVGSLPVRITNLFRDGWIESLALLVGGLNKELKALVAQVGELDLSRYPFGDEWLVRIVSDTAKARATGRLTRVKVHSTNRKAFEQLVRMQQGEEIGASADLGPTRGYNNLDSQTFHKLLRFGRLSGARDLALHSSGALGEKELSALLTADLSKLRSLRFYNWTFTRAMIAALVDSPALVKLTTLQIPACGVQGGSVSTIIARPLFANLKVLDLSWNNIGKVGVEALMRADVSPNLKELVLTGCPVTTNDRKRLKAKYRARVKV